MLLAGIRTVSAQLEYPVEFTTAFPFTVGDATVPPGTYTIRPDDDNPAILELTGGRVTVLFLTNNAAAAAAVARSEVVFKRYGDTYVLKTIWVDGSSTGAMSVAAEGERHATKNQGAESEERVAAQRK